jgi:two-component system, LuxR family, sensor kinase FixL
VADRVSWRCSEHSRKNFVTDSTSSEAYQDEISRLRAVLDSAVDGIITIDERGRMEAANPAAERLFGYSAAEMLGRNVSMLMPSPDRDQHDQYLANYLRTGDRRIIGIGREVQGQRKDGSTFPLYLAVSEVSFGHRKVFTGFVHDLTDLRQAQQDLAKRDAQLEFMVENLPAAAAYVNIRTGEVRFNPVVQQMTGHSVEDLSNLDNCFSRFFGDRATRLRKHYELSQRLWGEQPVRLPVLRANGDLRVIEFRGYRYDGHEVWLLHDVTERDRQETELRIRDQAIQASNEGVVIADATKDGFPIVFVNRAFEQMTGYSAAEAVGHGCHLICGEDGDSEAVQQFQKSIAEHRAFRSTVQCVRKDSQFFWNEISVAPVYSASGKVTHLVAVMEDVSERRQAQQQLLQSERLAAIGQMVTGLAHESRNALQRAQACMDMLSLDLEGQPEQLELTEKIRRALDDLHRYYEEVRNYAAPINLECRAVDVAKLWQDTWRNLEASRKGRDFQFIEAQREIDTVCSVDEHRLDQVFRNIMENALSACSDPGQLHVSCVATSLGGRAALKIVFRDNGPGFTRQSAESAFQPFFTTKQKGTGLGMAIAKRIVEAHGGEITISDPSTQTTGGAEIVVTLPLREQAQDAFRRVPNV